MLSLFLVHTLVWVSVSSGVSLGKASWMVDFWDFLISKAQNLIFESYNLMDKLAEFGLWPQKPLSVFGVCCPCPCPCWKGTSGHSDSQLFHWSLFWKCLGSSHVVPSSVPCCPTSIRSPKDSSFGQVLGYSQFGHMLSLGAVFLKGLLFDY